MSFTLLLESEETTFNVVWVEIPPNHFTNDERIRYVLHLLESNENRFFFNKYLFWNNEGGGLHGYPISEMRDFSSNSLRVKSFYLPMDILLLGF